MRREARVVLLDKCARTLLDVASANAEPGNPQDFDARR